MPVHREFDVDDSAVAPSLEGIAAVARVQREPVLTLDDTYYDTANHDLAVRQITLRRRAGGADAGWRLILPPGPDPRTEVQAPLADEIPAECRDVVAALVRDRPLVVLAKVSTKRIVDCLYGADAVALAEFADDEITARLGEDEKRWREWRLALSSYGHPELLDQLSDRLLDAGAQPCGDDSKLARALRDSVSGRARPPVVDDRVRKAVADEVENLLAWDRAVRADVDDSVHQMRVTTRKIRSLLQASESAFGLSDDAWILDELRQLASVLGVARDAEVLAQRYDAALDELPDELVRGPVRERLVQGARRRYHSGWRKSVAAMRSARYFRLLDALEGLVAAEPPEPVPGEKPDGAVEVGYKRIRKRAKETEKAEAEHRDEALHRIRKAAKRLRYTAGATGDTMIATAAKDIQSLLGDHQDAAVSRTHLSQQADAAHAAGEDTFTYGLLYEREGELARQCREQLAPALKALKKAARKEL